MKQIGDGDSTSTRTLDTEWLYTPPITIIVCFSILYRNYHPRENRKCMPVTDLRNPLPERTVTPTKKHRITEHFLNFHFSGRLAPNIGAFKPNINGKVHIPHDKPPQVFIRPHSVYCLVDELRQGSFCPRRRKKNKKQNLLSDSHRRKK